ncbi:MAG: ABC transporter substrate-binding protein [Verrucomicrobia bacterium]|nr:ABC transporter substrate-binding protein [Verrucomicrobiota bacterium]
MISASRPFIQLIASVLVTTTALLTSSGCNRKPDTIKLGEFASMTGKEAVFGQNVNKGTRLAIEESNAAGGVLGRTLELITEDDQSKPGESATVVKKLISRDKVVVILGEITSGRTLEAAPIAQAAKIPLISPGATNVEVTTKGNYIFRICFIDDFQGTVMAKFARETLKLKRVAILSSVSSAQSVGLAKYFRERFTSASTAIAAEQKYSEGEKDFRAQLTAIKAAGADGIFVPGYYAEAALICKQARDLGLTLPLLGVDGWESPDLLAIAGAAAEGCYLSTHFSPESKAPVVVAFNERYQKRWGLSANALSVLGYDATMLAIDAIRRAGSTDGAKIRDALAATQDYPAVTGAITFDANRNPTKNAVVLTVKNGTFTFVQDVSP